MKDINIELLTFQEYFYTVNEDGKIHPDNAYTYSVDSYEKESIEDYESLINRFKTHGLDFEIREKKIDRWEADYCDVDEKGNILRDENNKAIMLSQEKKEKVIKPRFKYEHAIIDSKSKKVVGRTQDEWNCLLISVAEEYKGMSLGEKLLEVHRSKYPFRASGGHTPAGKETLYRVYQNKVSKFLASGGYSKAIKEGLLTKEKVKEILSSAMIDKDHVNKRKKEYEEYNLNIDSYRDRVKKQKQKSKETNYDMTKAEDLLLHTDGNYAILYNKKAFNAMRTDDINDYFIDKGLVGYSYIGGTYNADSPPKLFRLYGKNEKIKEFMAEVALNLFVGEPVRVFDEDLKYLSNNVLSNSIEGFKRDGMTQYELQERTMESIEVMSYLEKKFRKEHDQYDEKWILVHERITALAEEEYDKLKEQEELKHKEKRKAYLK